MCLTHCEKESQRLIDIADEKNYLSSSASFSLCPSLSLSLSRSIYLSIYLIIYLQLILTSYFLSIYQPIYLLSHISPPLSVILSYTNTFISFNNDVLVSISLINQLSLPHLIAESITEKWLRHKFWCQIMLLCRWTRTTVRWRWYLLGTYRTLLRFISIEDIKPMGISQRTRSHYMQVGTFSQHSKIMSHFVVFKYALWIFCSIWMDDANTSLDLSNTLINAYFGTTDILCNMLYVHDIKCC